MKKKSFDLQTKSGNIYEILNSSRRKDFIEKYQFFRIDGNNALYEQWISENMSSTTQNSVIEDIFKLAGLEFLIHSSITEFGLKVLSGRYSYFTKLECLVYYLTVGELLDRDLFIKAANVAIRYTRNELVKFQANLNLARYNDDNIYVVKEWLITTPYPTLFYRVKNLLWLFPEDKRLLIAKVLHEVLCSKEFSNEVLQEISSGIKQLGK
ncbi:hypothetical protein [Dyadobacter aurulentus]|uniref:hypothetical protein n=1 Tax=Dyadobacter sp. UC 10 TaxID=2605428 RepID=UPI0011F3A6D5|nr:hypothetical protein [Dyadobacter sp. UC 10]KAA0991029.1 hypothetical protein FXO21_13110 [Dyadobacter sp. UC 10]